MYIDAGTGSMLLQVLAATFFTSVFFFKNFLRFFSKKSGAKHTKLQGDK